MDAIAARSKGITPEQYALSEVKILTQQDRDFLAYFTDITNPVTCGKSAASYRAAFPDFSGSDNEVYVKAGALKKSPAMLRAIEDKLDAMGLNDHNVDMEHFKVIAQDKDLSNKMKGIQEYNKMKGRGTVQASTITVNVLNYFDKPPAEEKKPPIITIDD